MEPVIEKPVEDKPVVQTSIDIKDNVCAVMIDLTKGPVNAYGTLAFAQEMCSRYFLTKQIEAARAAQQEQDQSRVKVILPRGVKI